MKLNSAQVKGLRNARRGWLIHPMTAKKLRELRLIFDAQRGEGPRDWRLTAEGDRVLDELKKGDEQ